MLYISRLCNKTFDSWISKLIYINYLISSLQSSHPINSIYDSDLKRDTNIGRLRFLTLTFAEPKLRSKYLLKSKSEVI